MKNPKKSFYLLILQFESFKTPREIMRSIRAAAKKSIPKGFCEMSSLVMFPVPRNRKIVRFPIQGSPVLYFRKTSPKIFKDPRILT